MCFFLRSIAFTSWNETFTLIHDLHYHTSVSLVRINFVQLSLEMSKFNGTSEESNEIKGFFFFRGGGVLKTFDFD